jgi:hypothetical protein
MKQSRIATFLGYGHNDLLVEDPEVPCIAHDGLATGFVGADDDDGNEAFLPFVHHVIVLASFAGRDGVGGGIVDLDVLLFVPGEALFGGVADLPVNAVLGEQGPELREEGIHLGMGVPHDPGPQNTMVATGQGVDP